MTNVLQMYAGFLDPVYTRTFTDNNGNILDLTNVSPSSISLSILNIATGVSVAGTGTWTIESPASNGQAYYQWQASDLATIGNYQLYVSVQLPNEASPRLLQPDLLIISTPPASVPVFNTTTTTIVISVKDQGAKGDGTTDDTAAIQRAIAAANTAGGGQVFFPAGIYLTSTQSLYSKVYLQGAGIETTILKLKNGVNGDLLQGTANGYGGTMVNIAASNASGSSGGIYNWSASNMTLDGNKSNQSAASYGIRQYGYGFILQNLRIRNFYSDGIYSDWNGGSNASVDQMEAQVVNVKIHDCGGVGLRWAGPHDSHFANVLSYKNGSHGFHVGPNATALLFSNCHSYAPPQGVSATAWLVEGGYGQYSNCVSEGSDTANTVILAGDIDWMSSHVFGIVGNGALQVQVGIQLGQQAGLAPYPGSVNQSGGVTTAWVTSGCYLVGNFSLNNGGSVSFANETNNCVRIISYHNSGSASCMIGTPNPQTSFEVIPNGLTADGSFARGGGIFYPIKSNQAFRLGDRTNDVLNLNTNAKRLELLASAFRQYSDLFYSTVVFESLADANGTIRFANDANATIARRAAGVLAFGGTIALAQSGSAQVIGNAGTVTMSNLGVAVLNPSGNVTGVKLVAGSYAGQLITLINESAFSITFDVSGNSFVADGSSDVLPANTARIFVWNNLTNLWYKVG